VITLPIGPIAPNAAIHVSIADPVLAGNVAAAIAAAIESMPPLDVACPLVHLRSRKRLAAIAAELLGAIAIVAVTERNGRHLVTLVDGIRAAGAAGIQLVWNGEPRGERHVFAALERARANPAAAPVVVATTGEPVPALLLLIAHRLRRNS
jgi:hypothetical protein